MGHLLVMIVGTLLTISYDVLRCREERRSSYPLKFYRYLPIVNASSTLIALLFESGIADAIPTIDIMSHEGHTEHNERQVIPRILHQTYINDSIPAQWVPSQRSCIDLHPDYEYKLWTLSREFIGKEYTWFLETFDSYGKEYT